MVSSTPSYLILSKNLARRCLRARTLARRGIKRCLRARSSLAPRRGIKARRTPARRCLRARRARRGIKACRSTVARTWRMVQLVRPRHMRPHSNPKESRREVEAAVPAASRRREVEAAVPAASRHEVEAAVPASRREVEAAVPASRREVEAAVPASRREVEAAVPASRREVEAVAVVSGEVIAEQQPREAEQGRSADSGRPSFRTPPSIIDFVHPMLSRSGQIAPHGSFSLLGCLRGRLGQRAFHSDRSA
jgi:hypothetical protein